MCAALWLAASTAWAQTNEGLGVPRPGAEKDSNAQIEARQLSKLPRQTRFVEAEYPKQAAEQGIEAVVGLLLDINAQGRVDSASVTEPATPAGLGFDEAALIAAQQFEFEPAELDGKPIAVQLSYRYRFQLRSRTAPDSRGDAGSGDAGAGDAGAPADAAPAPVSVREPVVNFSGILRERGSRLPLPGVLVTVFREVAGQAPEGYEATSDAEGRFRFFDLGPGEWRVLAEPPGYFPLRTSETVAGNEALQVTYYIERGAYNPFDVTVTAPRPRKEVSRTVLETEEIDKVPGTFGDPLRVIQNFAGVARTLNAAQLIVRGSAPEDTKVFVDGANVPLIYHFGALRSVIPVGMLDSLEFYPGNFASDYGRATGGVIDVQIKKLAPRRIGGYADVSILDTGVYLEAPLGDRAAIAVAGRRSYIDFVIEALVPDEAPVAVVTAPRYYDYQLLANYRPAPAHDLRAFFFGSDDRLRLLFQDRRRPPDLTVTVNSFTASTSFYRTLFTYRYVPGGRWQNTLRLSQGRDWFKVNAGPFVIDVNLYSAQMRDTAAIRLAEWAELSLGTDLLYSMTDFLVQLPRPPGEGEPQRRPDLSMIVRSEQNDELRFLPAGYLKLQLRPRPRVLLIPGLRVEYLHRTQQTLAQPRFTGAVGADGRSHAEGRSGAVRPGAELPDGRKRPELRQSLAGRRTGLALRPGGGGEAPAPPDVRRDRVLQAPDRSGEQDDRHGERRRPAPSPHQRQRWARPGPRVGGGDAARVRQQLHRVGGLHPVAPVAAGLGQDARAAVRLRPDPHPGAGGQLPVAAQLAGGRSLPAVQRQPAHPGRGRHLEQRRRPIRAGVR